MNSIFKIGEEIIFNTYGQDIKLKELSGEKAVILKELTEDECDIEEVGRMYRIRFSENFEVDAFEDELEKINQ